MCFQHLLLLTLSLMFLTGCCSITKFTAETNLENLEMMAEELSEYRNTDEELDSDLKELFAIRDEEAVSLARRIIENLGKTKGEQNNGEED